MTLAGPRVFIGDRLNIAAFRRYAGVFDLLLQDGEDLRPLLLSERKERLAALVQTVPGLQLVRSLPEHDEALFAQACEMDLEGIIGKDLAAHYKRGVQPAWVKTKNPNYSRQEALGFR